MLHGFSLFVAMLCIYAEIKCKISKNVFKKLACIGHGFSVTTVLPQKQHIHLHILNVALVVSFTKDCHKY